jgi:hypothetical protein
MSQPKPGEPACVFQALGKFSAVFPRVGKFSSCFSKGGQPQAAHLARLGWKLAVLATVLFASAASAGEARVVTTGQLELEFRDGWLTRWKSKLTDEEIRFGSGKAIPEATSAEFLKADDTTASLTQTGASVWAVRVPTDKVTLVHADAGTLRQRYVLIQAKAGGLLLLLDDPAFAYRTTLERDEGRREVTLTFRTSPVATPQEPARWLIKQYLGKENWGAQHRLDYLTRAFRITAPEKRPTAWAQNMVFVVNDPPWCTPVAGAGWAKSLEIHHAWLDNLQRVVDSDKLLFCCGNWRAESGAPAPFAALMGGRVKRAGYHTMLRLPVGCLMSESARQTAVGAALIAIRAVEANSLLLEMAGDELATERDFFRLLRAELDQNGLTAVALGVEGEPSEAALPLVDFAGGRDPAWQTLVQKLSPAERLSLDAFLTDEELQSFALPPHTGRRFTRQQFATYALARWWGEHQPRLLDPKFFEPGNLARYRLNNERVLLLLRTPDGIPRLAFDNGEVLADLVNGTWTHNAALLDQHGPVFLKDKLER